MRPPAAHIHAGYSEKTSYNYKLEGTKSIKARLSWLKAEAAALVVNANAVTRSELIESFRDTRRRAKKGTPILGRDGSETGVSKPDLSSANKADESLARMHGFMTDVTRVEDLDSELDGKSPEELKSFLLSMLEQVDPNMHKQLTADVEDSDEEIPEGETLQ